MTSTTDPVGTDADLGQTLGAVLRSYMLGARGVAEDVPGGPRGYQILTVAASGVCRNQAGIAQTLGIDRTVMTALVDSLQDAALVERRPDPSDRRARQILLTAEGECMLGRVAARIQQVEDELLAPLSETEAAQLRHLLAKVAGPGLRAGGIDLCSEEQ